MIAPLLVGFSFVESLLLIPFVFYALLVVLVIVSIVLIDEGPTDSKNDGWFRATVMSALLVGLICWKYGVQWSDLKDHPLTCGVGFAAYVAIGTMWSFGKWYFFISKIRDKYLELKEDFIKRRNLHPSFPNNVLDAGDKEELGHKQNLGYFQDMLEREFHLYQHTVVTDTLFEDPSKLTQLIKPQASAHKASITRWIMCWPLSFAWTMLNDPLRKLANVIFARIKSVFQRMSDKMFHGI